MHDVPMTIGTSCHDRVIAVFATLIVLVAVGVHAQAPPSVSYLSLNLPVPL